jgi:ASC-1-like (ASCH) protein
MYTPRLITTLQPLANPENNNYIVLDFDKVSSQEDVDYIIEYFKNNNYTINIFKSKSYGVDNKFNIKAVMMFDSILLTNNTMKDIKEAIVNYLNTILYMYCETDIASAKTASYQAPTHNEGNLFYNEGVEFNVVNLISYLAKKPDLLSINFDNDSTGWFYNHLISQYGAQFKASGNPATLSVSLPTETKSKFSYFWTKSAPYLLQHPQKSKNVNMFRDFAQSASGKEYIRGQHLKLLDKAFSNLPGHKVNSRYFTIDNRIKQLVDLNDILVIKGIMGSGKSSVIQEFLNTHPSRVLLLTMRRSLALDMSEKYNVKNYINDLNNNTREQYKPGDSLVIQVDSLHKVNPEDFSYVVIDEFESLCLYVDSNLKNSTQYVKNIKYLKILLEKPMVLADAFINDFTLKLHFKDRHIDYITNTYKDTCQVFVYEHKQTFITLLEQVALRKKSDEFITCSFGTLAELFSVERLLQDHGIRVISITSDTTDEAKEILYKLFQEKHHNKYSVILFSPTITVGVSILNNVKHHFHFDSGKSVDPISSIQMLKRSRTVDTIHIFIKGKQTTFKSYDVEYLNEIASKNIREYLDDSRNIIFYNIDTDTLSKVGIFVNHFVAHSNFFLNDHENTFKFLLTQQFENIRKIEDDVPHHKFEQYRKDISSDTSYLSIFDNIDKLSEMSREYEISDITYLKGKRRTENEERELLFLEVKEKFPKLDDNMVLDITKEYNRDRQYIDKLNGFIIFVTKKDSSTLKHLIEQYALSNVSKIFSADNRDDYIKLLKFMSTIIDVKLQDAYSINDLKRLNKQYTSNNVNFSWFLGKIGYSTKNSGLVLTYKFRKFISTIMSVK